ncbi:MAG: polyhydroxyalkanoic acid synthase [Gammaproteobacteria bacterium]|nr:polyhydroxyalkanoic acid synthase [Gammaproteobacteria bacterium]
MANIHFKTPHNLSHEDARLRVEEIAQDLKEKLETNYAWKGDSLLFRRKGASGSIDVSGDFIEFNIKLGMMLTPLKGKIERTIRDRIDGMLHTGGEGKTS